MNVGVRILVLAAAVLLATSTHPQATDAPSAEDSGASADGQILEHETEGEPYVLDPDNVETEPISPPNENGQGWFLHMTNNPQRDIGRNRIFVEDIREAKNEHSMKAREINDDIHQARLKILAVEDPAERKQQTSAKGEERKQRHEDNDESMESKIAEIEEKHCEYWKDEVSSRGQLYKSLSKACAEIRNSPKEVCVDAAKVNVVRRGGAYIISNAAEDRAFQNLPAVYYGYKAVDAFQASGKIVDEIIAPTLQEYGECTRKQSADQRRQFCPDSLVVLHVLKRAQDNVISRCAEG